MDEMHASLARLEARIDHQEGRIDALCDMLELRGILPPSVGSARGDPLFGDHSQAQDLCSVWKQRSRPTRRPTRLHVGEATGV
jgi:hypothetical protein